MRTNENLQNKNIELHQQDYKKTALTVENLKGEIFIRVYNPTSWSLKPKVREICYTFTFLAFIVLFSIL